MSLISKAHTLVVPGLVQPVAEVRRPDPVVDGGRVHLGGAGVVTSSAVAQSQLAVCPDQLDTKGEPDLAEIELDDGVDPVLGLHPELGKLCSEHAAWLEGCILEQVVISSLYLPRHAFILEAFVWFYWRGIFDFLCRFRFLLQNQIPRNFLAF